MVGSFDGDADKCSNVGRDKGFLLQRKLMSVLNCVSQRRDRSCLMSWQSVQCAHCTVTSICIIFDEKLIGTSGVNMQ